MDRICLLYGISCPSYNSIPWDLKVWGYYELLFYYKIPLEKGIGYLLNQLVLTRLRL